MYFNCITFFVVACATVTIKCFSFRWLLILLSTPLAPQTYGAPVSRSNSNAKGCFWLLILRGSVGDNFAQTKDLNAQPGADPPQSYRRRNPCRGNCGSSRSGIRTWHGTGIMHCFSAIFHILLLGIINIKTWTGNWAPLTCYFISPASNQIIWGKLPHSKSL